MGVYYDFYTEVSFNGRWINIDSHILGLDNKLHHCPVICGQSYLRDMLDELSAEIYSVPFEKSAEGTQTALTQSISSDYLDQVRSKIYDVIDYQTAIKDRVKESPIMRGYVSRVLIAMFRRSEIDDIDDWLTPDDFAMLDKSEQVQYSYFEWDDRGGWRPTLKRVVERVGFLVDNFNEFGIPYELSKNLDVRSIKEKDVRLIVRQS